MMSSIWTQQHHHESPFIGAWVNLASTLSAWVSEVLWFHLDHDFSQLYLISQRLNLILGTSLGAPLEQLLATSSSPSLSPVPSTHQDKLLQAYEHIQTCLSHHAHRSSTSPLPLDQPWVILNLNPTEVVHQPYITISKWLSWLLSQCHQAALTHGTPLIISDFLSARLAERIFTLGDDSQQHSQFDIQLDLPVGRWAQALNSSKWWIDQSSAYLRLSSERGFISTGISNGFSGVSSKGVDVAVRPHFDDTKDTLHGCLWEHTPPFPQYVLEGTEWEKGEWFTLPLLQDSDDPKLQAWSWRASRQSGQVALPLPCHISLQLDLPPNSSQVTLISENELWGSTQSHDETESRDSLGSVSKQAFTLAVDHSFPKPAIKLSSSSSFLRLRPSLDRGTQRGLDYFIHEREALYQPLLMTWRSPDRAFCQVLSDSNDSSNLSSVTWGMTESIPFSDMSHLLNELTTLFPLPPLTSSGEMITALSSRRSAGGVTEQTLTQVHEYWATHVTLPREGSFTFLMLCYDLLRRGVMYPITITLDATPPELTLLSLSGVDQHLVDPSGERDLMGNDLSLAEREVNLLSHLSDIVQWGRWANLWGRCIQGCEAYFDDLILTIGAEDQVWKSSTLSIKLEGNVSLIGPYGDVRTQRDIDLDIPVNRLDHAQVSIFEILDTLELKESAIEVNEWALVDLTVVVTDPLHNETRQLIQLKVPAIPPPPVLELHEPETNIPEALIGGEWDTLLNGNLGELTLHNPHSIPLSLALIPPHLSLRASRSVTPVGLTLTPEQLISTCLFPSNAYPLPFYRLFNYRFIEGNFEGGECELLPPLPYLMNEVDDHPHWLDPPLSLLHGFILEPGETFTIDLPTLKPPYSITLLDLLTPPHLNVSEQLPSRAQKPLFEELSVFTVRETACIGCEMTYLLGREVISLEHLSFSEEIDETVNDTLSGRSDVEQQRLQTHTWFLSVSAGAIPSFPITAPTHPEHHHTTYIPLNLTIESTYEP